MGYNTNIDNNELSMLPSTKRINQKLHERGRMSPGIRHRIHHSESDVAAGFLELSKGDEEQNTYANHSKQFLVLGFDISHFSKSVQFTICATGVFACNLVYGYLQELLSVQLLNRRIGLFLALCQFSGYCFWSMIINIFVHKRKISGKYFSGMSSADHDTPIKMYILISLLRAFDLAMTNMAMQHINYPAKTVLKSSKSLWTMIFGLVVLRKTYSKSDYAAVSMMVAGLFTFLHADSKGAAVFESIGVLMLIASLISDGAVSNLSEELMSKHSICQDEFIFCIYFLSTMALFVSALGKGDLYQGIQYMCVPGTMEEIELGMDPTWSIAGKLFAFISFSTFGFFGSSFGAAITKNFGALTMSITSTVRKAGTLFFSFLLFPNNCTLEHVFGIVIFLSSLVMKALGGKKAKLRNDISTQAFPIHIV